MILSLKSSSETCGKIRTFLSTIVPSGRRTPLPITFKPLDNTFGLSSFAHDTAPRPIILPLPMTHSLSMIAQSMTHPSSIIVSFIIILLRTIAFG